MALEPKYDYIDDLNPSIPDGASDFIDEGDDNIRGIKSSIKGSLPNLGQAAVTSTAAELNQLAGNTVGGSTVGDIVTNDDTQTLTNKTLTDPTINGPVINGPVINGAVTGTAPKVLLNQKVIEIGDWNMDADTSVSVAHGLTYANIRSVIALIRDDADTSVIDFASALNNNNATSSGNLACQTTNVVLTRDLGGAFDNTNYDSTSYNRGWITILYVD